MARKPPSNSGERSADELLWLETYFIVFPQARRPTLAQVERALTDADPRLKLENLSADDDGMFASVLVQSPEDHAAVEVSYECGDAIVEQNLEWAKQLHKRITPQQLQQLMTADARLDVAHFERTEAIASRSGDAPGRDDDDELAGGYDDDYDDGDDDDFDDEAAMEAFDPSCLLTVVESLSTLTRGLAFDPAAGEVV